MDKLPKNRKDAIKKGSFKYFTGIPCKQGHTTYRYTKTSMCYGCAKQYSKKSRQKFNNNYTTFFVTVPKKDEAMIKEIAKTLREGSK